MYAEHTCVVIVEMYGDCRNVWRALAFLVTEVCNPELQVFLHVTGDSPSLVCGPWLLRELLHVHMYMHVTPAQLSHVMKH